MASVLPVLLLCLLFQCVASTTYGLCMIENATYGGSFNLSVWPTYYKPNMNYTVTISGLNANMMVALSASSGDSATGEWQNDAANCTGIKETTENETFSAMWTASSTSKDYVKFKAYVSMSWNMSYVMNKTIRAAPTTTPPTDLKATTPPTVLKTTTTTIPKTTTTTVPKTTTYQMTTKTMAGNTTAYINTTTSTMLPTTVKPTGGAITFKPLGGFVGMLLLFVAVRELLL